MNEELSYEQRADIGKITNGLFVVVVLNMIISLFLALTGGADEKNTSITIAASVISGLFMLVYGGLLIKLEKYSPGYKLPGILCVVFTIFNTFHEVNSKNNFIISIIVLVLHVYKEYKEIDAHTCLLRREHIYIIDWQKVAGLLTGYVVVSIISLFASILLPVIGAFGVLVAAVILLIYNIKKWIYLRRTARVFMEDSIE